MRLKQALAAGAIPGDLEPRVRRALRRELALLRAHPEEVDQVLGKWGLGGEGSRLRWLRAEPDLDPGPEYELVIPEGTASVVAVDVDPLRVWLGDHVWSPETGAIEPETRAAESSEGDVEVRGEAWGRFAACRRSTGEELGPIRIPDHGTVMGWSVAGDRLVACGCGDEYWPGFVHVYRLPSMELEHAVELDRAVWSARLEGELVCGQSDGRFVYDLRRRRFVAELERDGAIAVAPGGRWLVDASAGLVRIWDLERGDPRSEPTAGFAPMFAAGGRRLICDRRLLDADTGAPIAGLDFTRARPLEGGPPRDWLMTAGDRLVTCDICYQAWDLETGAQLPPLPVDTHFVHWSAVGLSPSGRYLACSRVHGMPGGLFDLDTMEPAIEIGWNHVERFRFVTDAELLVELRSGDWQRVRITGDRAAIEDIDPPPGSPPQPEPPYRLRRVLGAVEIVDRDGAVRARMTAESDLAAHPTRPMWGGHASHVELSSVAV